MIGRLNDEIETPGSSDLAASIEVRRLYISAGHNFFGHHGKPPGENPMAEVAQIECVAGRGVRGDRFFDFKQNYKGQITFFGWETYEAVCRALGVRDRPLSTFRRNVITTGVDLNKLIGQEFQIQAARFRGTEECQPCYWMDQAFAPGAFEFLKGRGGLRAVILRDGILRTGEKMTLTAMLLTGGRSQRMGRDKATLIVDGEPLWQRQLRVLQELQPTSLWVSARVAPPWCPPGIEVVPDELPSRGPLSGLAAGLCRLQTSHLLVLAIDLPRISFGHLRKLWSLAHPGSGVIPLNDNYFEPLCAIYPREAMALAQAAINSADASLQPFANTLLSRDWAQAYTLTPQERSLYLNLNTPSDLPA